MEMSPSQALSRSRRARSRGKAARAIARVKLKARLRWRVIARLTVSARARARAKAKARRAYHCLRKQSMTIVTTTSLRTGRRSLGLAGGQCSGSVPKSYQTSAFIGRRSKRNGIRRSRRSTRALRGRTLVSSRTPSGWRELLRWKACRADDVGDFPNCRLLLRWLSSCVRSSMLLRGCATDAYNWRRFHCAASRLAQTEASVGTGTLGVSLAGFSLRLQRK
mmetsp:Transcript_52931/g.87902  ORF Transcript_52931/g.87902 Transcript_52931/m.87902 type:complete len:221 (+) Transcript_52931:249-911(+)